MVLRVRTSFSNFKPEMLFALRKWSPIYLPSQPQSDFNDKTDYVSPLHSPKITSVWSNVASISQKQTIRLRILPIWWCSHTRNEHDVGSVGF